MTEINVLANLNEKQQLVVSASLKEHLAIIAGAGSGKTRVLVHRIAWLIQQKEVQPTRIMAVTFTNKAAAELRERVELLTQLSVRSMWLGTFHGLAHRFLRLHWQQAKLPESFQILDSDDQYRLIKKVHHSLNLDDDKWPPTQSQWYINNKKDAGQRPHQISIDSQFDKILQRVYETYEEQCARSGLVDFAELLLRSYEVLSQHKDLREHYQARFAHILVDEFQDTNAIQYAWLKLLAGPDSIMMVVGDDDQSIYSWRGAQAENISRFKQDFDAKVIRLEQNYRSTKNILAAANAVIAENNNRFGKNLWTDGKEGELLSLYMAFNEHDEARFIASQIKFWLQEGTPLRDMAILYRSNAQSRVLEEELLNANLPYRIYGGLKFFERAEIKDTLAYLRLIANPHDDAAFERAVNMPPRGIGNTTLAIVREQARENNITLWQAVENLIQQHTLSARASQALSGFCKLIRDFQEEGILSLHLLTKQVIDKSGLYEYYSKDRSDKTQSRLENLQEFIEATQQYRVDDAFALPPLHAFLSYVALESGEQQAGEYEDSVQLMTFHSAKGLEFDVVFLSGMEEGLFPHKMSIEEPGRLEEERRLCYVGMTRARRKLYLTYAEARRVNGTQTYRYMSRFITEIPAELLHEIRLRAKVMRPVQFSNSNVITKETGLDFHLGERVHHRTFGEGVVLNYEGQGPQARIQVKFRESGTKWLVAEFAKLEKVSC